MVTYLPRSAWAARAARGSTGLTAANVEGEALHWPGMTGPISAAGSAGQARVASALRGWQNYHMDVHGWSDIAYQVAIDQAGRAWTLRGINIRSGANGDADVNRRFGAFLLVLGPGEQPSDAMKATVKGVITDFRRWFPHASATPKGHRDVRAQGTDCPGPIAYAAIKRGDFTPGTSTPPPVTPPKDGFTVAEADRVIEFIKSQDAASGIDGSRWTQEVNENRAQTQTLLAAIAKQAASITAMAGAVDRQTAAINALAAKLPKA